MERLSLPVEASTANEKWATGWWNEINGSTQWQDGVFYFLCAAYALVSAIALIQLIRIQLRVPEFGWTTQKVFHLMNFIVNGVRAIIFGFHTQVFLLKPNRHVLHDREVVIDLGHLPDHNSCRMIQQHYDADPRHRVDVNGEDFRRSCLGMFRNERRLLGIRREWSGSVGSSD